MMIVICDSRRSPPRVASFLGKLLGFDRLRGVEAVASAGRGTQLNLAGTVRGLHADVGVRPGLRQIQPMFGGGCLRQLLH